MDVYEVGMLQINLKYRGINRETLAVETRGSRVEFTKNAVKAYQKELKKKAILLVPITNIAFSANGQSQGMFDRWIKTLVWDTIGSSQNTDYVVSPYQEMRNQMITK